MSVAEAKPGRGRARAIDIDRCVGARIRERRLEVGMTLQKLADQVGITYQQLYKYETGRNRLSTGRFLTIADALLIEATLLLPARAGQRPAAPPKQQRLLLELVRNFAAIADPRRQQAICDLARALAGSRPGKGADLTEKDLPAA